METYKERVEELLKQVKDKLRIYKYQTMAKDDIYIAILKYGKQKGISGVEFPDLTQHLLKKGYITEDEIRSIDSSGYSNRLPDSKSEYRRIKFIFDIHHEVFVTGARGMNLDSYFKLIEHTELVEARKNSKLATILSFCAIAISLIAIIFSYTASTKLNQKQFDSLIKTIESSNTTKSVERIQDPQGVDPNKALDGPVIKRGP